MIQAGDIIAVEGSEWISQEIIRLTRRVGPEQVSHVGGVTATAPFVQVTAALTDVKTQPLDVVLASANRAWLISPLGLSQAQREAICRKALSFSGQQYGWSDIVLQAVDAATRSRWATDHFAEKQFPICSMMQDILYESVGLSISTVSDDSITPNDILTAALAHPAQWHVEKIK